MGNREYKYFISFNFRRTMDTGFGNTVITINERINTAEQLQEIKAKIEEWNQYDNVVIMYYQLMK